MGGEPYRGRIAPTPTGYLHLGHAQTFLRAFYRARNAGGTLIYREEDLDLARCRPEFAAAAMADCRTLGIAWEEGPDIGGPHAPYRQSQRTNLYRENWRHLLEAGLIYPSQRSRKDLAAALETGIARFAERPPGNIADESEILFPSAWREMAQAATADPAGFTWRFRVPDGRIISFQDALQGEICLEAGRHFGDFVVWRRDDVPAYELAVVVDDIAMAITEVVRGADLLVSTARQLLLYEALGAPPPGFFHGLLVTDTYGRKLAKREAARGVRHLLEAGETPETILAKLSLSD